MATIVDVAKRAGVSTVTVSRVINDAPNVNAATRERVEMAIRELGYSPSVAARSLRSKRTRSLALIVPDITNAFWTTVARGVEDAAQSYGYSILLCNTDEDLSKQQRYLDLMVGQRVDGMVVAPCNSDASRLAVLRHRGIATVVIDRRIEGWDVDMVYGDSRSGAYALTQHLIGLGHRRIAILSGPEGAPTGDDRIAGYRLALAEAGIDLDPRLVRRGGFSGPAGRQLTGQLLDEGLAPTAVFAANNAIALGVIEALGNRGLRIPHDIALVCFDDFPQTASFFPFLTVIAQPAYDMGANAAQLLFSRMESPVPLKPRRVVLPVRLIVRYSCGGALQAGGQCPFRLPLEGLAEPQVFLVKPIADGGRDWQPSELGRNRGATQITAQHGPELVSFRRPDVNRLLRVLRRGAADYVPHVELRVSGRAIYERVLERELRPESSDNRSGSAIISPEAQVEFAQRLGMDAVACEFAMTSEAVAEDSVRSWNDLARNEPPAALAAQLSYLERYLRAAQGTGVGVFASIGSFFANALRMTGWSSSGVRSDADLVLLEHVMDQLLLQGERLMQAVCDRFAADLAFVMVNDDVAIDHGGALAPDLFERLFVGRMRRLIMPVREHGLLAAFHTGGAAASVLPMVQAAGFDAVHGLDLEHNDLLALREIWAGKLAFMGGVPSALLRAGTRASIEAVVRQLCSEIGLAGGYVIGSSAGITDAVPVDNFLALVEAVQKYGRRSAS